MMMDENYVVVLNMMEVGLSCCKHFLMSAAVRVPSIDDHVNNLAHASYYLDLFIEDISIFLCL